MMAIADEITPIARPIFRTRRELAADIVQKRLDTWIVSAGGMALPTSGIMAREIADALDQAGFIA